jgi:hypothetical protein
VALLEGLHRAPLQAALLALCARRQLHKVLQAWYRWGPPACCCFCQTCLGDMGWYSEQLTAWCSLVMLGTCPAGYSWHGKSSTACPLSTAAGAAQRLSCSHHPQNGSWVEGCLARRGGGWRFTDNSCLLSSLTGCEAHGVNSIP